MAPDPAEAATERRREAALRALGRDDEALLRECALEFFVGGGPGGQHRNVSATAVRLTHLPTGIAAVATERRSQAQNRSAALERLKGKLRILSHRARPRRPSRPTRAGRERRLEAKRRRGARKRERSRRGDGG